MQSEPHPSDPNSDVPIAIDQNKTDQKIADSAHAIRTHLSHRPRVAVVLGSGQTALIQAIQAATRIAFEDIPHFPISRVKGHPGQLIIGTLEGIPLLLLAGRVHYYEGHTMQTVAFPVRVLHALGIDTLILTNSAGAIDSDFRPGDLVCLEDHINWMGDNPLRGSRQFVDLSQAFDSELRQLAREAANRANLTLRTGVYIGFAGPCYETPAEIRAARVMGADVVGMSTVPEVIMANALNIRVLGISMVTNMAAGMTGTPLSHQEVITNAAQGQEPLMNLIRHLIPNLVRNRVADTGTRTPGTG